MIFWVKQSYTRYVCCYDHKHLLCVGYDSPLTMFYSLGCKTSVLDAKAIYGTKWKKHYKAADY